MRTLSLIVLTMACLADASNAQAQGSGFSFGAEGRLAVGATDRVPGADLFLFGDATARLAFGNSPFGLELGFFGLGDALDTPHETYGAATWDFANGGRLSVGVPRPAYDSFAVSRLEAQFPSLGVARTGTSRSAVTFGAMFANFLPYGVRFENDTARLRFAASVHTVPNQDLTVAGFGAAYPMGDWALESAVEVSWGAMATEVSGKVQAHADAGPVSGGVGLYLPGTFGRPEAVELFGAIEASDQVSLSGIVQVPLEGSTEPSAGASVRYSINESISISAGVLTDPTTDAAYNALIGFRF